MGVQKLILGRFINASDLPYLSEQEQRLYKLALLLEVCKLQLCRSDSVQEQEQYKNCIDLFCKIFPANWGVIVLKPPRASLPPLCQLLEEELIRLLKLNNLRLVGSFRVRNLSESHIRAIYPGDTVMPYWGSLEKNLVGKPAIYYFFQSLRRDDIHRRIEAIKGWYRADINRKHFKKTKGLRSLFYQKVLQVEGAFPCAEIGSEQYEDSGIHAPISLTSRFLQILGTMGCDKQFTDWARIHLDRLFNDAPP